MNKWIYLYAGLAGIAFASALIVVSAAIAANDLGGVVFGMILLIAALFLPLAVFTGAVARRLDVLAETGKDRPTLS